MYKIIILSSLLKLSSTNNDCVTDIVKNWAPLVWLAPGEEFFPLHVPKFLNNVILDKNTRVKHEENFVLTTKQNLKLLLKDKNSFIYGINPSKYDIPVYAVIEQCENPKTTCNLHFRVTYWLFYPYNKGKNVCMLDIRLMPIPLPIVENECAGRVEQYGNHVGEWEHLSLYFEGNNYPTTLFISTHDVGAYYIYDQIFNVFRYRNSRNDKGILQRPIYPAIIKVYNNSHPIVFAANGSHGLWATPGRHVYNRFPYLHDDTGFGESWVTWKNVEIINTTQPEYYWAHFKGKWGNRKFGCYPLFSRFIPYMCTFVNGPTGPMREQSPFTC